MNKVILIGNLGGDGELKYTQGGQPVLRLNVCTTEKWKSKDGKPQEKSTWHRCNYWGKPAEAVSKYCEKGKQVAIEGSIETRSWDKGDGTKGYSTEIRVDRLQLLGGGPRGRTQDGHSYNRETGEVGADFEGGFGAGEGEDNILF